MNKNHNDVVSSDTDNPDQLGELRQQKNSLPVEQKTDVTLLQSAAIDNNAEILNREQSVTAREQAVSLREDIVASRELQVRNAEAIHVISKDHLNLLQQANAHLVIASIEAQKMAEKIQISKDQLAHLAHHDVLTDLPNRILLQDRLSLAIELAGRQCWQLAVMFMDLDRFKHINDSLGHAVGDMLLQSVAQRLEGCARHSDTISRQGGDEFLMLLPYIERAEDAALSAQKMLEALAPHHRIDGHNLHISVSIGISIYPNDGQDTETLIKNADMAMYSAKENGRNNYKFFAPDMMLGPSSVTRLRLACAVR